MRKNGLILLSILLLVASATGQEHAPTAAQCQADVAVWGDVEMQNEYEEADIAFLKNGIPNSTHTAKLAWKELNDRLMEMGDCSKVDPERFERYGGAAAFYRSVEADRVTHFMFRHNLWPQFYREDAQGKR